MYNTKRRSTKNDVSMKDKPGCESRGGGGDVGAKQDDSKKT